MFTQLFGGLNQENPALFAPRVCTRAAKRTSITKRYK